MNSVRSSSLPPQDRVAEATAAMGSAVVVMEGAGALVLAALASRVGAAGPFLLMAAVTVASAAVAVTRIPRAAQAAQAAQATPDAQATPGTHEPALT